MLLYVRPLNDALGDCRVVVKGARGQQLIVGTQIARCAVVQIPLFILNAGILIVNQLQLMLRQQPAFLFKPDLKAGNIIGWPAIALPSGHDYCGRIPIVHAPPRTLRYHISIAICPSK